MSRIPCYAGKILRINLSNGEILTEPSYPYVKEWFGSSGIAINILFNELDSWVTPYDPANIIVFGMGILQGTVAPAACKMTVSSLSPMTGGWGTGASDSRVGGELKRAGYDLVVITGKAHEPVYLYINDDKVEIRSAVSLWGKTTWETVDLIQNELDDPSIDAVCIGPAGEYLVRGACIIQNKNRAFGRCGTGAVMGSKNLKAMAAKGSGGVDIAHDDRFMKIVKKTREKILNNQTAKDFRKWGGYSGFPGKQGNCQFNYKNFQELILPEELFSGPDNIDPRKLVDKYQVRKTSFPGCPIGCGAIVEFSDGKYAGYKGEKSQWEPFSSIQSRLAVREPQFVVKVNALANQLGCDVDMLGGTIGWAMECFEKGIIDTNDTGGIELEWGNADQIIELLNMICYRKGFGNLLAEGSARASQRIGRNSDRYCISVKKQELYEVCRGAMAWALGAIVSTRGGGHTTGVPQLETVGKLDPERMAIRYGVKPFEINPLTYAGKPEIVMYAEAYQRIANCLGICHMNTEWFDFDMIDLSDMAELYSAATGLEVNANDLKVIAYRQLNLEKVFNFRHAGYTRKDDLPSYRDLNEPIPSGTKKGFKLNLDKWNKMLDRYYEIHGWDKKTGLPTKESLDKLDIGYAFEVL